MKTRDLIEVGKRLWPEQDAAGFTYFDFLHAQGSPRTALFYSQLFWPDFVEFEGMVFLEGTIDDEEDRQRVRDVLRRNGGDSAKTEKSFNAVEIPSLFGGRSTETTDAEDRLLAGHLCSMWKARLRELFSSRTFSVETQAPNEHGDEITVCFYQCV